MKLTVTLESDGQTREALPVRAIPYVTDWGRYTGMSPDEIAMTFSRCDVHSWKLRGISTYCLEDGKAIEVKPTDWGHFSIAIEGLNERLPAGKEGRAAWREGSIKLLPAGVFVWTDEFESAFISDTSRIQPMIDQGNGCVRFNRVSGIMGGLAGG